VVIVTVKFLLLALRPRLDVFRFVIVRVVPAARAPVGLSALWLAVMLRIVVKAAGTSCVVPLLILIPVPVPKYLAETAPGGPLKVISVIGLVLASCRVFTEAGVIVIPAGGDATVTLLSDPKLQLSSRVAPPRCLRTRREDLLDLRTERLVLLETDLFAISYILHLDIKYSNRSKKSCRGTCHRVY
jgi:hypothetical protein